MDDIVEIKEIILNRLNNPANPKGYGAERAAELVELFWKELGVVVTQEDMQTALTQLRAGQFGEVVEEESPGS